jgi:hypothetical protein
MRPDGAGARPVPGREGPGLGLPRRYRPQHARARRTHPGPPPGRGHRR